MLAGGEPDDARESQLLDREIVLGLNQLLLARFQFHLRAQPVNGGRRSSFHLIGGLIVKSLRGVHLRGDGFDARGIGDGLQIIVANGEDHQVARIFGRVLRGLQILRGGVSVVDGVEIEQDLREVSARIVITKRPDDSGNASRRESS